ncbi:hypothetical protein GCM10011585_04100 [Edaphobacter dinghuensis]|uniref:Uncharacterized protein n=1 Tax=Edaphobacter dinghuensis TaxID=1560005 RepID=A0A917H2L1_9BACT|nr:hypothetical protein GCM10011585_04100 [Edaphobacter dinghuensis]
MLVAKFPGSIYATEATNAGPKYAHNSLCRNPNRDFFGAGVGIEVVADAIGAAVSVEANSTSVPASAYDDERWSSMSVPNNAKEKRLNLGFPNN